MPTRRPTLARSGASAPVAGEGEVFVLHDKLVPHRSWWRSTWPYLLAFLFSIIGFTDVLVGVAVGEISELKARILLAADLLVGIGSFVLVTQRHRWPLAVAVILTAATAVSSWAWGPAVLALVSYGASPRAGRPIGHRIAGIVGLSLLHGGASIAYLALIDSTALPFTSAWYLIGFFASALVAAAALLIGLNVGARRELLASFRDRTARAEEFAAASTDRARTAERNRIAREMHDVLAHRISLVALHAGAISHRADLPPEEVRRSADVITDNAHRALTELREVLGVLRADAGGEGHTEPPQPTLAALDALVQDARSVGSWVDLDTAELGVAGDGASGDGSEWRDVVATVPPTVSRAAYRIIQEGLTNARKHAPNAHVTVRLAGVPGRVLEITVVNPVLDATPSPVPGSGSGLTGMAERATLVGGTLEHGEEDSAGGRVFALSAWLPWSLETGDGWAGAPSAAAARHAVDIQEEAAP